MLDLNELFPPPAAAADSSRQASSSFPVVSEAWAAEAATDFPLVPVIPPLEMTLELAVDSLLTGKNVFTGSNFVAKMKDSRARVDGTFAHALLGNVVMQDLLAEVDIANGRLEGTFSAPRAHAPRVPLTDVKGKLRLAADRILARDRRDRAALVDGAGGAATIDLTELASARVSHRVEGAADPGERTSELVDPGEEFALRHDGHDLGHCRKGLRSRRDCAHARRRRRVVASNGKIVGSDGRRGVAVARSAGSRVDSVQRPHQRVPAPGRAAGDEGSRGARERRKLEARTARSRWMAASTTT